MAKKYWLCLKCGVRHERTRQKCDCGGGARPKKRVPKHAITLRDDPYEVYNEIAKTVHNVHDESCCVCGKPRSQERRHDRDHDHKTGLPRGLACGGNSGCNILMPPNMTAERAEMIARYLRRHDEANAKKPTGGKEVS